MKFLDLAGLETLVSNIKTYIGSQVSSVKSCADDAKATAEDAKNTADIIENRFYKLSGSTTKVLNQDNTLAGAAVFSGIESGITITQASLAKVSTDSGYSVIYSSDHGVFVLKQESDNTYFNNWRDADSFGTATTLGRTPYKTKIYFYNNSCYYYNSSSLLKVLDVQSIDYIDEIYNNYVNRVPDEILSYSAQVSGVSISLMSTSDSSTSDNCAIVYNTTTNTFLLRKSVQKNMSFTITYFNNWAADEADLYGTASSNGRIPKKEVLYICANNLVNNFDIDTIFS